MPSHPEASPQATCRATTRAGKPCRKQAVADGLCTFHSGTLDLAELGRRGGKARGRKQKEHASDQLEARAYAALGELLDSGSATARTQAVRYTLDRLTADSPAGLDAAKKALWLDLQQQTQQQMPAARAKLARLIDSRAAELANQKTEAAVAELVEGRATEKAQELYDARMRAETEAVKAELRIDASDVASPGGQPSPVELAEQERARLERERIERELRVDPSAHTPRGAGNGAPSPIRTPLPLARAPRNKAPRRLEAKRIRMGRFRRTSGPEYA